MDFELEILVSFTSSSLIFPQGTGGYPSPGPPFIERREYIINLELDLGQSSAFHSERPEGNMLHLRALDNL